MPDFMRRDTTPELMDTEATEFRDFEICLEQLAQANRLSLACRPTLAFLNRLHKAGYFDAPRTYTIVDAGSGYGDMLRRIDAWAAARQIAVDLVGIDMNPWSARAATAATPAGRPLRWLTSDVFDYTGEADLIVSSLFTHHLPDTTLLRFLAWMETTAQRGWFINDLERHPVPYYALKAGFALTLRHRFIRHDGPVSVASAFRRSDWQRSLATLGLTDAAEIRHWLPYRLCVSRLKPA